MRHAIVVLMVLLASASMILAANSPRRPKPISVFFMVVRASDNRPIARARVKLYSVQTQSLVRSGTTNSKGTVKIRINPGMYRVVSEYLKLTATMESVALTVSNSSRTPIVMRVSETSPPAGTLEVLATGNNGQPVQGAAVTVVGAQTLTTGSDGKATFSLLVGQYNVSCSAAGYTVSPTQHTVAIVPAPAVTRADFTLTPIPPATGGIVGNVKNAITNVAMSGVTVVVRNSAGIVGQPITDSSGNYTSPALTPGVYNVDVTVAGFQNPPTQTVTVSSSVDVRADFVLQPIPTTGSISGRVTDANGVVVGAVVSVGSQSGTTAIDGTYNIANIPAGSGLTATAKKAGYADASRSVNVVIGQNTPSVDFFLVANPTTGSISGTTRDGNGTPLAGVSVVVNTYGSLPSAADGSYTVPGIPAGPNQLAEAFKSGYVTDNKLVNVVAGQNTPNVDFTLVANPGKIYGSVSDANSQPVGGATVEVRKLDGTIVATRTTGSDGKYAEINSLSPADYDVVASKTGYSSQSKRQTVVAGGNHQVDLTINVLPGQILGSVTDNNSQKVAGATVEVKRVSDGTSMGTRTTDGNGAYASFTGLTPGDYDVIGNKSGHNSQTKRQSVVAGGNHQVDLVLPIIPTTGSISGRVTDANGAIVGAVVSVGNQSGTTGSDGTYSVLNIPAGSGLTATAKKAGYADATKSVSVVAGQNTPNVDFTLVVNPTTGGLKGAVTDSTGKAIQDADVTVQGPTPAAVTSAGNGGWQVNGLSPGIYTVLVTIDDFQPYTSSNVTVVAGLINAVNSQLSPSPQLTLTDTGTALPLAGLIETQGLSVNPVKDELIAVGTGNSRLNVYRASTGELVQQLAIGFPGPQYAGYNYGPSGGFLVANFGTSQWVSVGGTQNGPAFAFASLASAPGGKLWSASFTNLWKFEDRTVNPPFGWDVKSLTGGNKAITTNRKWIYVVSRVAKQLTRLAQADPANGSMALAVTLPYEPGEIHHIPGTRTLVIAEIFGSTIHLVDTATLVEYRSFTLFASATSVRGIASYNNTVYISTLGPDSVRKLSGQAQ